MSVLEIYKQYIINGKYFEAHEALEEVWQELRKTDNEIQWAYKGLINAAVALELKKRKRDKKVYIAVWNNFEKYRDYYSLTEKIYNISKFMEKFKPF